MMSTAAGGSVMTFTATWDNVGCYEKYISSYNSETDEDEYHYYMSGSLYSFNYRNYISFDPSKIEVSIADISSIKWLMNTGRTSTELASVSASNCESLSGSVSSLQLSVNGGETAPNSFSGYQYDLTLYFSATNEIFSIKAKVYNNRLYDDNPDYPSEVYNGFKAGNLTFTLKFII